MKIVIAAEILPPDIGGTATWLADVVSGLQDQGHDIEVVSFGKPGVVYTLDVPVHIVNIQKILLFRWWDYFMQVQKLARSADVIFCMGTIIAGVPALAAKYFTKTPMLLRSGGDVVWEKAQERGFSGDVHDLYTHKVSVGIAALKQIQHFVAHHADYIFVNSEYHKSVVRDYWNVTKTPLKVVYTGKQIEKHRAQHDVHETIQGKIILGVGRLITLKGWLWLFESMREYLGKEKNVHIVLIGDGPQRAELEQYIHEHKLDKQIHLLGYKQKQDVLGFMEQASVVVNTSQFEAMSNVVLEAITLGVPVVASRVGGNTELVKSYQYGVLVPYNDATALRQALVGALEKTSLPEWDQTKQDKLLLTFSYERMIADIDALLEVVSKF